MTLFITRNSGLKWTSAQVGSVTWQELGKKTFRKKNDFISQIATVGAGYFRSFQSVSRDKR